MPENPQPDRFVQNLELLNKQLQKQASLWRVFWTGMLYGVGFFVGSAIIATLTFGMVAPFFGQIHWVRDSYETGVSLQHQTQTPTPQPLVPPVVPPQTHQ